MIAALPGGSGTRASELNDAFERARRYRLTGRSVFGVELARGKRARQAELEKIEKGDREKGKGRERDGEAGGPEFVRKGVAVRLESFYRGALTHKRSGRRTDRPASESSYALFCHAAGRFFEPFYLVFDRVRATDEADPLPGDARLQLVHHTVPAFVPLRALCIQYLGVPIRGQSALYEEGENAEVGMAASSSEAKEPDLDVSPSVCTVSLT